MTAYATATEHLDDLLALLRAVLAVSVERKRGAGEEVIADRVAAVEALEAKIRARTDATDARALPLERLRRTFGLTATELRVLVFLTAMEVDTALREVVRFVVDDPSRPAPDIGMLGTLIYGNRDRAAMVDELAPDARLFRFALIHTTSPGDTPLVLRRVRVADRVLDLLHGRDALDREVARHAELLPPVDPASLVIAPERLGEVVHLVASSAATARTGLTHPVIVLSGPEGCGRRTLVRAAATRQRLTTLRVRCATLPRDEASVRALGGALVREAILWHAVIVLDGADRELDGGAALDDALLGGFAGPIAAIVGKLTGKPPRFERGAVVIELAVPDRPLRAELWRRAIPGADEVAAWAAERYAITPGVIVAAARSAQALAAARDRGGGRGEIGRDDVHAGLRGVLDAKLGTLGTRITWRQTWADVVLPDDIVLEIREFIARIRHRRIVHEDWGFGRKVAKGLGLSALFSGPPGTGKTMVAKIIADELGLDLYQVDLSRIVSKWVGETEKNLAELFEAAEAGHAVLLFDEADSLFTKRTDVKSSNDRYANLEVNYLLQRLESFAGATILTTNNETAIDEAFRRRLTLRVSFPMPEADEREMLWKAMLPDEANLAAGLDFADLADRFEMSGGYIKNAVLRAAFMAADAGTPISMEHLRRAAALEYQAMGKLVSQR